MKWQAKVVPILLCVVAMVVGAESPTEDQGLAQETQVRGYWTDASTGLMWAGKDNGQDVNWRKATKYCRDLRLGGYSDWRLATIEELQGIFDKSAEAPGANPRSRWHEAQAMTFHVKGNLFLTGDPWSSSQRRDDRGRLIGFAWFFDFHNVRNRPDPTDHDSSKRALCVRRSGE